MLCTLFYLSLPFKYHRVFDKPVWMKGNKRKQSCTSILKVNENAISKQSDAVESSHLSPGQGIVCHCLPHPNVREGGLRKKIYLSECITFAHNDGFAGNRSYCILFTSSALAKLTTCSVDGMIQAPRMLSVVRWNGTFGNGHQGLMVWHQSGFGGLNIWQLRAHSVLMATLFWMTA